MAAMRLLFMVALLTVALVVPPGAAAQEGEGNVAILVVDVFEPLGNYADPPPEAACVMTLDVLSQTRWDGGTDAITSALGPFQDPHGRKVFLEVQDEFTELAASARVTSTSPVATTDGAATFSEEWIRDILTYETEQGLIYLVGIDTDAYDSQLIVTHIQDAITLLNEEFGITRFVINMSFVLVPCGTLPEVGYRHYVAAFDQPQFADLDLVNQCEGPAQAQYAEQGLAEQVDPLREANPDLTYCQALAQISDNEQTDEETAEAAGGILMGILSGELYQPLRRLVHIAYVAPQIPQILEEQYAAGPIPPFLESASFTTFFQNDGLQAFCTEVMGDESVCIAIASAGNDGLSYSYAPGSYESVISVSADYQAQPSCDTGELEALHDQLEEIVTDAQDAGEPPPFETAEIDGMIDHYVTPLTNSGEVIMNGKSDVNFDPQMDCLVLWGTSFAAPRLSFQMALYLLRGGTDDQCSGRRGDSQPPLGYQRFVGSGYEWQNLPPREAARRYCTHFDEVMFP